MKAFVGDFGTQNTRCNEYLFVVTEVKVPVVVFTRCVGSITV